MTTLYQIDPSALEALDEASKSQRLKQGAWGDGDTVCALSAMFKREDGSPIQADGECPADSAPKWLLAVVRVLFDGSAPSVDHALIRVRPIVEWLSEAPRKIPKTAKYAWLAGTVLPQALSAIEHDDAPTTVNARNAVQNVVALCERAASGDMPTTDDRKTARESAARAAQGAAQAAARAAARAADAATRESARAAARAADAATRESAAWGAKNQSYDRMAIGLLEALKEHELKAQG
ncbi:hypothetical protein [uncultured Tateyamaria sp.]|uniref:hypothetical protein n=1 Tax=uncultured Tateyamaria sp. TaxID=455651 RepID=UPI0026143A0C|nr:hypothetical protein [uncultured Tateyamaria sp.]